jgi:hypothetical protein
VVAVSFFGTPMKAAAQMPTCTFIAATPSPGPGAGNVTTSVSWDNCPATGNVVEVALFQVTAPGKYKALSTKSVNNVGASGAKTWTFTGLTPGIQVVANCSVYDQTGALIASVGYTPPQPITVPANPGG